MTPHAILLISVVSINEVFLKFKVGIGNLIGPMEFLKSPRY
tara:strand:- start:900 stop:1022 length:123 start_codon:yes stop_codon:yes gene_type:complete